MNYFLLALATLAAFIALSYTVTILRVAFGNAVWNSGFAAIWNCTMASAAVVTSLWLFQTAVGG